MFISAIGDSVLAAISRRRQHLRKSTNSIRISEILTADPRFPSAGRKQVWVTSFTLFPKSVISINRRTFCSDRGNPREGFRTIISIYRKDRDSDLIASPTFGEIFGEVLQSKILFIQKSRGLSNLNPHR
jgi:hypothetical protein